MQTNKIELGKIGESIALETAKRRGYQMVATNVRTPYGEIDLILRDCDGTLVFVEVRRRGSAAFGGAGASIQPAKQRRIVFAARHYLLRLRSPPPCRFDVVLVQDGIEWLQGAFDAG